jgi:hypothetical protein
MTNVQLYLAIGIPVLVNTAMVGLLMLHINARLDDLKDLWRAELHRVEEVLDARLKHLEER